MRGVAATPFLTSALDGVWSASRSCRFTPGESAPGTYCIGGWMGSITGLDAMEKTVFPLPGIEPRLLGLSVYNLVAISSYPSSLLIRDAVICQLRNEHLH
jgi:hypothetical protein